MKRKGLTAAVCAAAGVAAAALLLMGHGGILPARLTFGETADAPDEEYPQSGDMPALDTSSWELKLVNEDNVLSQSFEPETEEIENGQSFDSRAADKLRALLSAAREAGFDPELVCGYRPYSSQAYVFFEKVSDIEQKSAVTEQQAKALARRSEDYPGTSEHQLGLAADIVERGSGDDSAESAENDALIVWLAENCVEFGFVQRYPADKESVTGKNEPWHFRYVGEEAARFMKESNLSLEQLLALYK